MFNGFDISLFDSPDFKEDSVREEIIVPILRRLGYAATGPNKIVRSKTLVHPYIYVGTRQHPVTIIPDYTLLHENQPILILDAKHPNEDVRNTANVQQAYSYSIHPEIRAKHFALCNGRRLVFFDIEKSGPILDLQFNEFEARWSDIEKHLGPRFLLRPELRRFAPDLGLKFMRMGLNSHIDLIMMGVRLGMVARIDDNLYTASANCDFGGEEHCASFDFAPSLLPAIVKGLPELLRKSFTEALGRTPFHACADLVIEIDIAARLGIETTGASETFVPLIIREVKASRFNHEPLDKESTDIPPHVFRLRKAFRIIDKKPGGA